VFSHVAEYSIENLTNMSQCLHKSASNRKRRDNGVNTDSSRSHAIFIIRLRFHDSDKPVLLMLVDLAGSEASNDRNVFGDARKEASNINKSLSNLSALIKDLVETGQTQRYRSSKLTSCLRVRGLHYFDMWRLSSSDFTSRIALEVMQRLLLSPPSIQTLNAHNKRSQH